MRRSVTLMLLTILPFSLLAQQAESVLEDTDYDKGYTEGQQDGLKVGQGKWAVAGYGGGFLGCCLGGSIVYSMAKGDTPRFIPEGSSEFRTGYIEGYKNATKSKQQEMALKGGVSGVAALLGVALLCFFAAGAAGTTR
jgi:hypothetical protein